MNRPVVFLGPSLPRAEAEKLLDAEYLPPVRQGDVLRAMRETPSAIAIIDGVFRNEPSVRHRECLFAMAAGIPLFGAASMGAIRAAELHGHGMIGAGLIYRWFRRHTLVPDDAVALQHGPDALGSPPLGDALIDIRMSLKAAARARAIPRATAGLLATIATALPFADRQLDGLGARAGLPDLDPLLGRYRVEQKAADARAVLRIMADHVRNGDWPRPETPEPAIIHAWLDDLRDSGFDPDEVLEMTGSAIR